jgi:hypothetical protein
MNERDDQADEVEARPADEAGDERQPVDERAARQQGAAPRNRMIQHPRRDR